MRIQLEENPTAADRQIIWDGLRAHNEVYTSGAGDSMLNLFLRDERGAVMGGLFAKAGRGWLHIITLWIDPSLRGQGYGAQLLTTAEAEGMRRGCHSAYLDTFSFQAPNFYVKCGYKIFGTLNAFPDEHQRFFMRKTFPVAA